MSDIKIYSTAASMPDTPLTGDVVICSEAFNGAPANSVHLATVGGATPTWKSFANDYVAPQLTTINFASSITPGTEQEIAALTGYDVGTYALNSDGSAFYVYDGTNWNIFNPY